MIESILKNCFIEKGLNYTAAGTGDTLNSDIFDLQGYDSILLVATTGDVTNTAVGTLKAYIGDNAALSDGAYATSTAEFTATATSADNKIVVLDVVKPGKRYVRADFVRATANIVVENIIAIKYNAKTYPVTQGADVVDSDISINRL